RSDLDFALRQEIPRLLIEEWPGDDVVKAACLKALTLPSSRPGLDEELAWEILLGGFPQDDAVTALVVESLANEVVFSGMLMPDHGWKLLAANFANHPKLIGPLDRWIEKQEYNENEVSYAALVGRTDIGKRKLLAMLSPRGFGYWPALALANGWGMGD